MSHNNEIILKRYIIPLDKKPDKKPYQPKQSQLDCSLIKKEIETIYLSLITPILQETIQLKKNSSSDQHLEKKINSNLQQVIAILYFIGLPISTAINFIIDNSNYYSKILGQDYDFRISCFPNNEDPQEGLTSLETIAKDNESTIGEPIVISYNQAITELQNKITQLLKESIHHFPINRNDDTFLVPEKFIAKNAIPNSNNGIIQIPAKEQLYFLKQNFSMSDIINYIQFMLYKSLNFSYDFLKKNKLLNTYFSIK